MLFTKVGTVILLVSDMERSVKFYNELLGLPVKTKTQSPDWVEFFNRETTLSLHAIKRGKVGDSAGSKDTKLGTGTLVGFMVSDIDSTVQFLKENNIRFFKEPRDEPFGKHAIIEDPDGHLISIAQLNNRTASAASDAEEFDLLGLLGAE
ncbi:MAG: glyoxalase/bleomycin resistance/dioxygenase family protein [Nitrososphaeraceae archaeon]|nr:glyoxalase/bleomycin resistance/dioxygenase family protein [Nitrososphaeraceae archaeon]